SVLRSAVAQVNRQDEEGGSVEETPTGAPTLDHFLLSVRPPERVLLLVLTSDRGLCGAFNSGLLRQAERKWKQLEASGKEVKICVIGRKGRDYFTRRNAPILHYFSGVWDNLGMSEARRVAHAILKPYIDEEVDEIHLLYNEFKSAMTQVAVDDVLFPLTVPQLEEGDAADDDALVDYIFEPDKKVILDVLVPMYIEVTLLRALYESMASELGARMTAMDSATKNANDM